MALIFSDPNSAGPFSSFQVKETKVKVFKLTSAHFTVTTATNTKVGVLPADAAIVRISYWNKTKLAGNSIDGATMSVGSASAGTQFVNAFDVFTTVATFAPISPVTGIMQAHALPNTTEIPIWVDGLSTTGTPTSGEIYLMVEYVR